MKNKSNLIIIGDTGSSKWEFVFLPTLKNLLKNKKLKKIK